ncbi:MAG TPA: tetratricopeptide repeat protein [Anaeromyxobacteraceae bacterium]|nr:tetratricopeptide repeat protein [Anaeromyxobacteraceae bacterium]
MRRRPDSIPPLALALLAACAGAQPEVKVEGGALGADLVAVSREMARVDLGAPPAAGAPPQAAPAGGPAVTRFLALYALPREEETWGAFRALAQEGPGLPWGSLGMARVYISWGTLDQAEAELGRARAADPKNWIALLLRALMDERGGRGPEARAGYQAVLEIDGENPMAWLGLARISRLAGDPEAARREAQRSLDALPGQAAALRLLGETAEELGRKGEAVDFLSRAAASSPRDASLLAELARARLESGDASGAVADWKAALALGETVEGMRGLLDAATLAGDAEAQLLAAQGLASLEPNSAENWRRLAALRLEQRDEEGAEGALRRAVERDPQDSQSRLALGRILVAEGQVLLAMEQFRAAGEAAQAERAALERRLLVSPIAAVDPAQIQRVVAGRIDRLPREDPAAGHSGSLVLRVTVGPGGEASEVAVVEDTARDEWVRASAYWNLKNATYPNKSGRLTFRFSVKAPKVKAAAD